MFPAVLLAAGLLTSPLTLEPLRTFTVHAARATTSGNLTDGAVSAAVFLDEHRLATAGNEDRVRVTDLETGRERWRSENLGKDVEHLSAAGRHLHAEIYGGVHFVWDTESWRLEKRLPVGHGWMAGLAADGDLLVAHRFDDQLHTFTLPEGTEVASRPVASSPDVRGVRVTPFGLALVERGRGVVVDPRDLVEKGSYSLDTMESITQAWMVSNSRALVETCGASTCTVRIGEGDGLPAQRVTVDTSGGVWAASVPSNLSLSADGRHLFFVRDGIAPRVIRLEDGATALLPVIPRTMSACPTGVFSPFDPTLLVVTMTPAPNQVTLYRVR